MKEALKQHTINDEFYTPEEAVIPLLKYLPKTTFWKSAINTENRLRFSYR